MTLSTPPALADRYTVLEPLGAGSQGATVKAQRLDDDTLVVIKTLHLANVENWKAVELFEREAETLARIELDGVPRLIEYIHDEATDGSPRFYLVQELIEGETALARLERGHVFEEAEAVALARNLLQLLHALHTRTPPVIHRDIKPSNIILRPDGRPALVDFGAVAASLAPTEGEGSTVAGTFGYMAPEQFRGAATPASDIYGVGATLVHLLSGIPPHQMETRGGFELVFQSSVRASPHFIRLLEHFLHPDETLRIPTAEDALRALDSYNTLPPPEAAQGALVPVADSLNALEYVGQPGAMELFNSLPQAPRSAPPLYRKRLRRQGLLITGGLSAAVLVVAVGGLKILGTMAGPFELILVIVLPFFLAWTFGRDLLTLRKLVTRGRKAVGTVTDVLQKRESTGIRYEFSADGHLCAGMSYVRGDVALERGHYVGVLYDPDKPQERSMIYPVPKTSITSVFDE